MCARQVNSDSDLLTQRLICFLFHSDGREREKAPLFVLLTPDNRCQSRSQLQTKHATLAMHACTGTHKNKYISVNSLRTVMGSKQRGQTHKTPCWVTELQTERQPSPRRPMGGSVASGAILVARALNDHEQSP